MHMVRDTIAGHHRRQYLLHGAQHDFVRGRSYLMKLLSVLNMVTELMGKEEYVDIYFLYFSKAIDIANHKIICANIDAPVVSPK